MGWKEVSPHERGEEGVAIGRRLGGDEEDGRPDWLYHSKPKHIFVAT